MEKVKGKIVELEFFADISKMEKTKIKLVTAWLGRLTKDIAKNPKKYGKCSFKYFFPTAFLVLLFLSGCVSARYNVKTGELVYHRFGDQKLSGVIVEIIPSKEGKPDELNILLESQQSDARMMLTALEIFKAGMEAAK